MKKYGWLAAFFVLLGLWLALPLMQSTDSVSVEISLTETEQSLRSLDSADNPQGAPGTPVAEGRAISKGNISASPTKTSDASVLIKQSGAPRAVQPTTPNAPSSKRDQVPARPAPPGGLDSVSPRLSGGFSSASFVVTKPFGLGPNPASIASSATPSAAARPSRLVALHGPGVTLEALKQVAKATGKALDSDAERASSFGARAFDAGGAQGGALAALKAASSGAGLEEGDVPANLKTNDPHIDSKQFEPPAVGPPKEVARDNPQAFSQQIMMMLVMMAVGGLLGPTLNGIGAGIASGLGLNPPKNIQGGSDVTHQVTNFAQTFNH